MAASLTSGLSGLDIMRGIRDGTLPAPPMAETIGFRCVVAEPGEVGMRLDHHPSLENTLRMLHGGVAATMLDTAMGAAAHTMLPIGAAVVTLDLTLTYVRPIDARNTPVTATGRVLNVGRRVVYVTGDIVDRNGTLVVHAVGNFSVLGARATAVSLPPSERDGDAAAG
ncbi:PaaI family thioesterase [Sphingomonas sp. BK069]|uniref:PaaI family thioesterase n=1 Tax=Sphingomonas sp. BK069 TaxID=2586979 RepID=UPI0017CA6B4B|nr:PaaI family thioesterase [Sphingomonas sp. BK069]MBB3348307.1 uncharacterized protein (TIGR00369 family) [Sphingomonas sp. BK069]